jgi:hypothetical protein
LKKTMNGEPVRGTGMRHDAAELPDKLYFKIGEVARSSA